MTTDSIIYCQPYDLLLYETPLFPKTFERTYRLLDLLTSVQVFLDSFGIENRDRLEVHDVFFLHFLLYLNFHRLTHTGLCVLRRRLWSTTKNKNYNKNTKFRKFL